MTLFEAEPNPVIEQLQWLDLPTLSPIEALNLLYQLQRDAKEKRDLFRGQSSSNTRDRPFVKAEV